MAGSSPTMKDVAREAGVSLGTVSKVFNGIPVGSDYRQRVEEAARKLNYQVKWRPEFPWATAICLRPMKSI